MVWVVGAQLHKKFKYVNPVKIRYSPAAVFVSKETFYSIPKEYQDGILAMRYKEVVEFCKITRKYTDAMYGKLVPKYIKESKMSPQELEKLREKSKVIWNEMAGKEFPKEALDELLKHLADYRSGKK